MRYSLTEPQNGLLFRKWRKFSVENLHNFVPVVMRAQSQLQPGLKVVVPTQELRTTTSELKIPKELRVQRLDSLF